MLYPLELRALAKMGFCLMIIGELGGAQVVESDVVNRFSRAENPRERTLFATVGRNASSLLAEPWFDHHGKT